jgi:hypothetical protein
LRVNGFKGRAAEFNGRIAGKARKQAQKKRAIRSLFHRPCLPLTSRRPIVIIGNNESLEFSRKIVEIVVEGKFTGKTAITRIKGDEPD